MKYNHISLMVMFCVLAACQDGIAEFDAPLSFDDKMHFNLQSPGVQTRVAGGMFEVEDEVGLFVTEYIDEDTPIPLQVSGNKATNLALRYDGETWSLDAPIYWGEFKVDAYAYHPFSREVEDVNSHFFAVSEDQSENGYEYSDFLWAKAEAVSQSGGTINLPMKHVMSKLIVKIVAGENYVGSLPIEATVHLHSTVTNSRVNLETGAVVRDPYSSSKSIKMRNLGLRVIDGVEAVVYEAIVVPQMLQNILPLIEINSKSVSYLLEDSFNFHPGTVYTYTATLNTSTEAIKVDIGCELEDWNSAEGGDTGGDAGGDGEEGGDDEGEQGEVLPNSSNLSLYESANCYIVSQSGNYKFKAVLGNTSASVGKVSSVEVLWESFGTSTVPSVGDLIKEVYYNDGYIYFSVPNYKTGNAVIAAKNSRGVILWTWHIWLTYKPSGHEYYNGLVMMDRNLGANYSGTGSGTLGLLYQWGRRNPYVGSYSNTASYRAASTRSWTAVAGSTSDKESVSDASPMIFYYKSLAEPYAWDSVKTAQDPCPPGWRVPDSDWIWGVSSWSYSSSSRALYARHKSGYAYFPLAGQISTSNGALTEVGSNGYYWTTDFSASNSYYSYSFWLDQYGSCTWDMLISMGASVRCQKDMSGEKVDFKLAEDLSKSGTETANSYIVSKPGVYTIPTVKGNTMESVGNVKSVEVLWESFGHEGSTSVGALIKGIKYEGGKIYFWTMTPFAEGNALIAAKDADGTVLWSWHIWFTDQPQEEVYPNGAGIMMDRNLGATNPTMWYTESLGLLYQWGRKDPFIGLGVDFYEMMGVSKWCFNTISLSSQTGTIDYSIKNPTTWIATFDEIGANDWCVEDEAGTRWQSQKTIYDPCPSGWRVPDGGPDGIWTKSEVNVGGYLEYTVAITLSADDFSTNYPCASYWLGQTASYTIPCTLATYWSCTPSDNGTSHGLFVNVSTLEQEAAGRPRTDAYSVRCMRE